MQQRGQYSISTIYTRLLMIFVFIIVVGSLIYNGIITPRNVLPELCFASNIGCKDVSINIVNHTVSITLVNNLASSIKVISITAYDAERSCVEDFRDNPILLRHSSKLISTLECRGETFTTDKAFLEFELKYFRSVSVIDFTKTIRGRLIERPK